MSTAVVIGGGISGLSSAYYLQKTSRFAKVIVLESAPRVGGWVKTHKTANGAKLEMGPRSIRPALAAGLNTLNLAEELGLSDDVIPVLHTSPAAKNRFIYANDKINALPAGFLGLFRKTPPFSKSLISHLYNDFKTPGCSQEDESIYSFFSRRFGEDVAKYAVDPMCRGIFAGDCRELSIKSCFSMLHTAEKEGGSVIQGLLIAQNKNAKVQLPVKPGILGQRRREEKWTSYSFRQGLQQLSDRLKEATKQNPAVEIVTNSPCSNLMFSNGKALLIVNGEQIKADHVISSIYSQHLAALLPSQNINLINKLNSIPAVDAVVVCMEFDGTIKLPLPGFGHLTPSFVNSCVLGVIYDSCTFPEHDRPDKPSTRFTVMMGGHWMEDLRKNVPSMSAEDLGDFAVKALQTQLGITQKPESIHVEVLEKCIPQYIIGHESVVDDIFTQIRNDKLPLSLVGCSYKGVSVNDCIYNAKLEVEKITKT